MPMPQDPPLGEPSIRHPGWLDRLIGRINPGHLIALCAAALLIAAGASIAIRDLPLDSSPADADMIPVAKSGGGTKKTTRGTLRENLAPTSRSISTTAPLAGGGSLAADRTLSLTLTSLGGLATSGSALRLANTDTLAGNPAMAASAILPGSTGMLFEGATANTSEGLLTAADVSADRTWTLPDATGSLVTTGDAGTVSGAMIADAYAGRSLTEASNTLDADAELYTDVECHTRLGPTNTDVILFGRVPLAATATRVDCLVGAATSATLTFQACDSSGGSCANLNAALTCTTTGASAAPPSSPTLAAGSYLRLVITAVSGTPGQVVACVAWTYND